jgi:glutaredoxin-like protein NrdH
VYTQPDCPPCKRVIKLLDRAAITHEIVDITAERFSDARTYVTEVLGAKATPVVVSDVAEPIIGYQLEQIRALIQCLTLNEETDGT